MISTKENPNQYLPREPTELPQVVFGGSEYNVLWVVGAIDVCC